MAEFSKADELAKLAELNESGVLSDKEFRQQRRSLLRQPWSPTHPGGWGVGIALVVVALVAGALVLALKGSSPARLDVANTSVTEAQVTEALHWAETYLHKDAYEGLCLEFVQKAWGAAGVSMADSDDPVTYWASDPDHWQEHSSPHAYNDPPRGALLFWGGNQWVSTGHVAIAIDTSGDVISTDAYPYTSGNHTAVFEFNVSQRPATTYNYLGWIFPGQLESSPPSTLPATSPPTTSPSTTSTSGGARQKKSTSAGSPPTSNATGNGSGLTTSPNKSTSPPTSSPTATSPPTSSPPTTAPPVTSPPATSPPSTTYAETVGGPSHTWSDYEDAGGTEGPEIATNQTVQIACKLQGFRVADGNTWWYRIAENPWSTRFYVSADAFYNNGETSGPLTGTPFVDPNVRTC